MIRIRPPENWEALDQAIRRLAEFDWLLFTSAHSVRYFCDRCTDLGYGFEYIMAVRIAVIGPATARELVECGLTPTFLAAQSTAEHFLREFTSNYKVQGRRFLLPLSNIARKTLSEGLRSEGGVVQEATAYINEPVTSLPEEIQALIREGSLDWIFFTSSSTASNFFTGLSRADLALGSIHTASIGPRTSETLREYGVEPTIEASEHTVEGMIKAING